MKPGDTHTEEFGSVPMRYRMADESAKAVTEEDVMDAVGELLDAHWDLEGARGLGLSLHDESHRYDRALERLSEVYNGRRTVMKSAGDKTG